MIEGKSKREFRIGYLHYTNGIFHPGQGCGNAPVMAVAICLKKGVQMVAGHSLHKSTCKIVSNKFSVAINSNTFSQLAAIFWGESICILI